MLNRGRGSVFCPQEIRQRQIKINNEVLCKINKASRKVGFTQQVIQIPKKASVNKTG